MTSSPARRVTPADVAAIVETRVSQPHRIAELAAVRRQPPAPFGAAGRLLLIAADHPARGSLRAGKDPLAMGNRAELLDRMVRALNRPGVDGVLGTADVVEELLLLGALEDKVVFGSMNRGGLAGTSFEMDDRFTGYDARRIEDAGLQGGKMLLRIDGGDQLSAPTLEACGRAVQDLADRGLAAMVEPFISYRDADGVVRNDLSTEAVVRSATVASGLAGNSAYTWLKLPVIDDMEAAVEATTLPVLLLGGEVAADAEAQRRSWARALASPTVRGMVVGRSLLFPPDGDVEGAVDAVLEML